MPKKISNSFFLCKPNFTENAKTLSLHLCSPFCAHCIQWGVLENHKGNWATSDPIICLHHPIRDVVKHLWLGDGVRCRTEKAPFGAWPPIQCSSSSPCTTWKQEIQRVPEEKLLWNPPRNTKSNKKSTFFDWEDEWSQPRQHSTAVNPNFGSSNAILGANSNCKNPNSGQKPNFGCKPHGLLIPNSGWQV